MEERDVTVGLLDFISFKIGCMYLSDLHDPQNLLSVQWVLRYIDPSLFGLEEWNDAVAYITGKDVSLSSGEQAVQYLLSCQGEKPKPLAKKPNGSVRSGSWNPSKQIQKDA